MAPRNTLFDLSKCARPNILALEPYRCARDDYKDNGTNILLDANENAYGPGLNLSSLSLSKEKGDAAPIVDLLGLNRYPDPHQHDLKELLISLRTSGAHSSRKLSVDNLFVGVGSDEAIDALLRCFCTPGRDRILTCPPTYGMYKVSAAVNDLEVLAVPLLADTFQLDVPSIVGKLEDESNRVKVAYFCSPGNPTGTLLAKEDLKRVLEAKWNGIVVLDEAYVDFAEDPGASLAEWVGEWENLVVMQTLSKAFGLAGIRVGAAFAHERVAGLLNAVKAPYNLANPSSELARWALRKESLSVSREYVRSIVEQRGRLLSEMGKVKGVGRLKGGLDSNFLLVEFVDGDGKASNVVAQQVYERLAEQKGVVVRFRGREKWCDGCLRITVGTEKEVDRFLEELKIVLGDVLGSELGAEDHQKEQRENDVVA